MIPLRPLLAVVSVAVVTHLYLEFRDRLDLYLCRATRQPQPPPWLGRALVVAAAANLLGPAVVAFAGGRHAPFAVSYLAGGLCGDAVSTHAIPTWISGRTAPAFWTWPIYCLFGVVLLLLVQMPIPFALGFLSFPVAVWPGMLALKAWRARGG